MDELSRIYSSDALFSLLEQKFFSEFLPLVCSKEDGERVLSFCHPKPPHWSSKVKDKMVIFFPPPPKIIVDPTSKPDRLGRVAKILAERLQLPLREKIEIANKVLHTLFDAAGDVAVAFSGGKDSLVALHLTLQIKPDVKVVFINTNIEFPETLEFIHRIVKEWNLNFYEVRAKANFWRIAEEQGLPIASKNARQFMKELEKKAGVKISNSCCKRLKETPARQFYRQHGVEGVVTGLRAKESYMRRINFANFGAIRYSSDYKALVSWPLYAFTEQDIEDYITAHNLPVNPLYSMGFQRIGCWACLQDMLHKDSRLFTLQRTHPGMYRTLIKKFGKQMLRILVAWADLEKFGFTEDEFDGLYRPCMMEMWEKRRKMKTELLKTNGQASLDFEGKEDGV